MPRGDGTGPQGKGSGTGRGQGKCITGNKAVNATGEKGSRCAGLNRGSGMGNGRKGILGKVQGD
ncbi:MAG: DUF5320 domain-containing protein [Syntrophomonas sp.]|nr:DUF5320 domain-containing protein [Syntrophomonas sp.]